MGVACFRRFGLAADFGCLFGGCYIDLDFRLGCLSVMLV